MKYADPKADIVALDQRLERAIRMLTEVRKPVTKAAKLGVYPTDNTRLGGWKLYETADEVAHAVAALLDPQTLAAAKEYFAVLEASSNATRQ